MLSSYLKIIVRNIKRHKGYAALNISGLTIGISIAALIMLYVQYEWEYDSFYPDAGRIYRVIQRQPGNVFMGTDYFAVTQEQLGRTMKSEFPEIDSYATLSDWKDVVVETNGMKRFDENILYATAPNFLNIFSYHFIKGSRNTALSEPNTVVLSESASRRLFGSDDPMGKRITVKGKYVWTVTGVFQSPPLNSQFADYGMIISFDTYASIAKSNFQWGNSSWYTYLLLKRGADPLELQAKFPSIVNKYISKAQHTNRPPRQYYLQPLKDIHLYNKANFDMAEGSDIKTVLILIALAFVILSIACINYVNLSTARASLRAREVGVRKVVGAKRNQLVLQFIGESVMLSFFAGFSAFVLDEIFLRSFFKLIGINLGGMSLFQPSFLAGFVLLVLVVGLLSGAYPAFILSMFNPASVLKGDRLKSDRASLRQILVIIQFAASIILIACTVIIMSQMKYILTKDMGYNRENVLVLKIDDPSVRDHLAVIKDEMLKYSSVKDISASSHLPINVTSETSVRMKGKDDADDVRSYQLYTDYNFLKTFDIPIVEGRDFSSQITTDSTNSVLINQALANSLGLKQAAGKIININGNECTIIGVMKDFNLHSVRHKIQPLFVALFNPWKQYLCIRVNSEDLPASISHIKSVWDRFASQRSFKYTFLDADFNDMYSSEERLSQIVTYASFLAIFIACLGLLGLVSFIIEQKRKEIGIRKVLGASAADVIRMLSKQFMILILLANIIAWPAAYYLMHDWLSGFVYRIHPGLWPFIISGSAAFIIAITAVSLLAVKAASANPVKSLRYE